MSNRIKQFRTKHQLSQRQLADLLKVNYRTVSRWENGDREPHPSVFELLKRLDVELQPEGVAPQKGDNE